MRCRKRRCLLTMLFVVAVVVLLIFVVIPLSIYSSSALQSFFIFARFGERVLTPEEAGCNATRNFYVAYNESGLAKEGEETLKDEVILGMWHVLPKSLAKVYDKVKDDVGALAQAVKDLESSAVANPTVPNGNVSDAPTCEPRVRAFDGLTDGESSAALNALRSSYFEACLRAATRPIVLYLHGNGGTRSSESRIPLYRLLADSAPLDRHVIAVDYRGYADSTDPPGGPSERGVVRDALAAYAWLAGLLPPHAEVTVWGHSLGTGISTQMVRQLQSCSSGDKIKGIVLEAPFNNMPDAVREYPLTLPFRHLPWFELTIMHPLSDRFPFHSDEHIRHIRQPILMLHAPDDRHVPIGLGERLLAAACAEGRPKHGEVKLLNVGAGYGHVEIVRYPGLVDALKEFETECREYDRESKVIS